MEVASQHSGVSNEKKHTALKILAHIFSILFHPVFIPVYVALFLLFWHPLAFPGFSYRQKMTVLASVAVNLTFFPLIVVLLLWRLRFIKNIYLRTQRERIIPYAASMIFYFWGWYVFRNLPDIPAVLKVFLSGAFLTVIAAWLANIVFKISMHALAVGCMTVFVAYVSFLFAGTGGLYLSIALLITGLVCTSRLIVSNHHPREIYAGVVVGAFCQTITIML